MGLCYSKKKSYDEKANNVLSKSTTLQRANTLSRNKTVYIKKKPQVLLNNNQIDSFKQSAELFLSLKNVQDNELKFKIKLSICI